MPKDTAIPKIPVDIYEKFPVYMDDVRICLDHFIYMYSWIEKGEFPQKVARVKEILGQLLRLRHIAFAANNLHEIHPNRDDWRLIHEAMQYVMIEYECDVVLTRQMLRSHLSIGHTLERWDRIGL